MRAIEGPARIGLYHIRAGRRPAMRAAIAGDPAYSSPNRAKCSSCNPLAAHGNLRFLACMSEAGPEHPFAAYIRTLGRGPGRSRALTREEARAALAVVLRGEAAPEQVGAFLMLLRYRGEAADETRG